MKEWQKLSSPWERLKWAREQWFEKYDGSTGSQERAAQLFNMPRPTYAQYERASDSSRSAKLDEDYAREFGKKYKVSWNWLLTGIGTPFAGSTDFDVNILLECGYIDAGLTNMYVDQSDIQIEPERIEWINGRDKVALRVRGISMLPDYKPNSILVFGYVKPLNELVNKDILAKLENGAVLVKKLRRGENGTWKLESTNSEYDPIENAQIIEARPVEAILLR